MGREQSSQRIGLLDLATIAMAVAVMTYLCYLGILKLASGNLWGLYDFGWGLLAGLMALGMIEYKTQRVSEVLSSAPR